MSSYTNSKIAFQSFDGYPLQGTLCSPVDIPIGAVLFVHGITSNRDELGFHSDMATFLAEKGFISLRFDYRYHGIYKQPLEKLTLSGIINDIDAGFDALKKNSPNSMKSFFVIGTSFGGGLLAYWVNKFKKNEIRKIILNAPVINYENDVLERNRLMNNGKLSDKAVKQLTKKSYLVSSGIRFGMPLINELKTIDTIGALNKLGDRVFIFHGIDDEDVPLHSTEMYMTSKTGLKTIPNVGHGFGIDIDEDLTHPETKAIHQAIYKDVSNLFKKAINK